MLDTIIKPIKSLFGSDIMKLKSDDIKKDAEKTRPVTEAKNEIMSVEEIYTPLSVAKEEIWRRWNDKELRKKVEDFLEGDVPEFLLKSPHATIVRHITSPNYELLYFMDLIKQLELDFMCCEFPEDKFVAKNRDKYNLCKMSFFNGLGKGMYEIIDVRKIVDIQSCEGRMFCDIKTLWKEDLVGFHHRALSRVLPEIGNNIFDISAWFKRKGPKSKDFYLSYLALFVCYGVLFENFSTKEGIDEKDFSYEIVLPTINKLIEIFGVKPLIVPAIPTESESSPHWWHYPPEIKQIINY